MKKITISAVLIVKNEEDLLARCLESVKDADEIIVCDTGSEDMTVEVAKRFTDKVYTDFKWCDSFEKARNHAKAKANSDWILSIDADEFCHDFSKVREAVAQAEKTGVCAINVHLTSDDAVQQKHIFPRLFRNIPEVMWQGAIHNYLNVRGEDLGNVHITYGYSPAHLKDLDRALRILTKEAQKPDAVRELFYLGREQSFRGRHKEALATFKKYCERSVFAAEKADALLSMARSYWAISDGEAARDACLQAIKINPHFKEATHFMSQLVWPKHKDIWLKMSELGTNEEVLFKRNF
jgi:glycosyltransferase involved in cell wall biosynthesis